MSRGREWIGLAVLLGALAATTACAQTRSYTIDVDPIRLGMKALEQGRLDEARAHFDEAVAAGYQPHRAQCGLAEIAAREGRPEDAERHYRAALAAKPDYPEAHAGLGLLLLRLGRDPEASHEFVQALAEKPGLWTAQYGQARILLAQGATEEARALLDRGARLRGLEEGEAQYRHGMALYHMAVGDTAAAEGDALVAFALDPAQPEFATLVARIYIQHDLPELAIDAFESALAELRAVLRGEREVRLLAPARPRTARTAPAHDASWAGVDHGLFEHRRAVRAEIARARGVPAYIVFGDATLRDLARTRPSAPSGMRQVRGVGDRKLADLGERFLAEIAAYCAAHDLERDVKPAGGPGFWDA